MRPEDEHSTVQVRIVNEDELRKAIERLKRYAPECRFDDALTADDRAFLRVQRIRP